MVRKELLKKGIVVALSLTLIAGASVVSFTTSHATDASGNSLPASAPSASGSGSSTSGSSSGSKSKKTPPPVVQHNTVKGVGTSTVKGGYAAESVAGIVVATPPENIQAQIAQSEDPVENNVFVSTWDITETGAPAAYQVLNYAAQTAGATAGPMFQLNFNKKQLQYEEGKKRVYETVPAEAAAVTSVVGIPSKFTVEGARYGVIRVVEGGTFTILEDLDTVPNTVTFEAPAGYAAYALVRF